MTVRVVLDDDGRPLAWGENLRGEEIPVPPDPPREHRWDRRAREWVHDPPTKRTRVDLATVRQDLADGTLTEREAVAKILEYLEGGR